MRGDARKRLEGESTLTDWLALLETAHDVCAGVRMDTPEDQALHDAHVKAYAAIVGQIRSRFAGGAL